MIEIDDKIVSADLLRECFACDIAACKGICCVEGNAGAPLEAEEVDILEREYEAYKPYMTPEGIEAVERQGFMVVDEDGDLTTPLVDDAECAYTYRENGITLVAGGEDGVPQADLMPFISDPAHAVFERHGRVELPPLVGVRPGARVRTETGNPGLQGAQGADRTTVRRGILQGAGSRRGTYQTTIDCV